MKLPVSWLTEWIDHGLAPDELAHRLTMLGIEVESVVPLSGPLNRLVIGRVTEIRPHPNADRLSLCREGP